MSSCAAALAFGCGSGYSGTVVSSSAHRNTLTVRPVTVAAAVIVAVAVAGCQTNYHEEDPAYRPRPRERPAADTAPTETAEPTNLPGSRALPPIDAEAELAAIRAKFQKPLHKVQIEFNLHLRGCNRGYLGALDQLEGEYRYVGDPDTADIVAAERDRFARGQAPTPEERKQMFPRLRDARSQYERNLARARLQRRRKETSVQIMYLRDIEKLLGRLIDRRDLAATNLVEVERQRVRRSLAEFAAELTVSGLE